MNKQELIGTVAESANIGKSEAAVEQNSGGTGLNHQGVALAAATE